MTDASDSVGRLPKGRGLTTPATRRRDPRASGPSARRQAWIRRLPLLPALIYMLVVTQVPFIFTVWYSLRGWNTLTPGSNKFVGLASYRAILSDSAFRDAAVVTIKMTASAAILSMLLGTTLAILINRKFLGRGVVRTMLITPFLVMPVATALLFQTTIYDAVFGLLNYVMSPFGANHTDWVGTHAVGAVVLVLVWEWTPFMMLIVLAGLQSESLEALEAARVDGANAFQTFAFITFQHLRSYLELGLLLGSIYIVQAFGEIFILTDGGGGSGAATTNLPFYIYNKVINAFDFSQGAAAGVIVVVGTQIVAAIALRLLSGLFKVSEAMG
jgi:sorbitol/mannitol transport system permease protein